MPIHEFECKACGHKFEEFFQAGEDEDIKKCRRCGKAKVERLVSAFCSGGGAPRKTGGCAPSGGFR